MLKDLSFPQTVMPQALARPEDSERLGWVPAGASLTSVPPSRAAGQPPHPHSSLHTLGLGPAPAGSSV